MITATENRNVFSESFINTTNNKVSNEEPLTEESIKAFDFTTIGPAGESKKDRKQRLKKTPSKK